MFVQMMETVGDRIAGQIYEPCHAEGLVLLMQGKAHHIGVDRDWVEQQLLERLDDGAGKECLFLPYVGEFGHLIMTHMRLVHFHKASRKIVCCKPGQEVLFPSASEFVTDWADPIPDSQKAGTIRERVIDWSEIEERHPYAHPVRAGGLFPSQEVMIIGQGKVPLSPRCRGLKVDVCLGVRHRAFCSERNWPHWQWLADALIGHGHTIAVIGDHSTSPDIIGASYHSGDYDTAAAIELLKGCKLYIGGDSGQSHLAAAVGCKMLIFRYEDGAHEKYIDRMRQENPRETQLTFLDEGWAHPEDVLLTSSLLIT